MAQATPAFAPQATLDAIGAEIAQYSRAVFENAGQTARSLISAQTFEDVVRLETDFAARSWEGFLASSAKLSELSFSLFGSQLGAWTARAKV